MPAQGLTFGRLALVGKVSRVLYQGMGLRLGFSAEGLVSHFLVCTMLLLSVSQRVTEVLEDVWVEGWSGTLRLQSLKVAIGTACLQETCPLLATTAASHLGKRLDCPAAGRGWRLPLGLLCLVDFFLIR